MRLNNMPIVDEEFIRWIKERMLQRVMDQPNLLEDTKLQAQVNAILIEDALLALQKDPNRAFFVTALYCALSLGQTSSPGFSNEEMETIHAQARSLMASALGKRSGEARRKNRPWAQHAEKLARDAYSNHPTRSNEKIADYISDSWKLADVQCPSHRTLASFVAELKEDHRIPQRERSLQKRTR
jgi:hypothetical protein